MLLLALPVLLISCKKESDEKPADRFFINENATVNIKPAEGTYKKAKARFEATHISAVEIVKQTVGISFQNVSTFGNQAVDAGFSAVQRDTLSNPPMLKRWATDLINRDGFDKYYLVPDFLYGEDIIFFRAIDGGTDYMGKPCKIRDTIAYTPNAVMRQIEADVKAALANKDTVLAYKAFNSWTFTPITGAEWRALKKQGLQ